MLPTAGGRLYIGYRQEAGLKRAFLCAAPVFFAFTGELHDAKSCFIASQKGVFMIPMARQDGLIVQEAGTELVLYDTRHHRVHRLNTLLASIWRRCNGQTSVTEIVRLLEQEGHGAAAEQIFWHAVRKLENASLLELRSGLPQEAPAPSRRDILRHFTTATAGLLVLPTITSLMLAPTSAQAKLPVLRQAAPGPSCAGQSGGNCTGPCLEGSSCKQLSGGGTCGCA